MSVSTPAAAKTSGLSTVVNTIASPAEAFDTIAVAPTWGWAVIAAVILLLIGVYLQGPATRHASVESIQQMQATSTLFANMTTAQKQRMLENAAKPSPWSYAAPIVMLFVAVFLNTLFMLIGNAVGRGQADFKRLWCGSMNIAVPTLGIGAIVTGLILTLRGADSVNSTIDVAKATPSLATILPHLSLAAEAGLAAISIFTIWGFFLNAAMLRRTAKTNPGVAYAFASIVLLLGAAFSAAMVGAFHSMHLA